MNRAPAVGIDSIREARQRIAGAIFPTPLVRLPVEEELFVKAENLQRTGSFKIRGAYNFLAAMDPATRARGVVAHSSGNHAQGVACAASLLGTRATIVIPEGAPEVKVARTRAWGAEIVRCRNTSDDRERVALELVAEQGSTLVPPFDHPMIIAGQGTAGLEICAELPELRNVLVPVGGGGLVAGVAVAVRAMCPRAQVIGVEPALAADAAESLASGRRVSWAADRVTRTMADGVRTQCIGAANFEVMQRLVAGVVTVGEEEILDAFRWYVSEARLVVEPTGALSLAGYRALATAGREGVALLPGKTVVLASGGNIGSRQLAELVR